MGQAREATPIGQKMAKSKSTILGQLFSKKNSRMDHTPPLVCPYHTITMSTGVTMDDRFFEAYPVVVVREWGIEDKYSPVIYRYCGHLVEVHIDMNAMQGYVRCLASYRQDAVSSWHWFQLVQSAKVMYLECPTCGSRCRRLRLKHTLGCVYCVPLISYGRWISKWLYQVRRIIVENDTAQLSIMLKTPTGRMRYEITMEELNLKPRKVSHEASIESIQAIQNPALAIASKRTFVHRIQRRVFLSGEMGWWCYELDCDGKLHWNQWQEETRDTDPGGDGNLRPIRSWPSHVLLPLIRPGSDLAGNNHRKSYNNRTGLRRDRRRLLAIHYASKKSPKTNTTSDT